MVQEVLVALVERRLLALLATEVEATRLFMVAVVALALADTSVLVEQEAMPERQREALQVVEAVEAGEVAGHHSLSEIHTTSTMEPFRVVRVVALALKAQEQAAMEEVRQQITPAELQQVDLAGQIRYWEMRDYMEAVRGAAKPHIYGTHQTIPAVVIRP